MAEPIQDRIALITGASRGIGLELARCLLGAGLRVMITGARDKETLDDVTRKLGDEYGAGRVACRLADAGSAVDAAAAVAETVQTFGRIDILINNAGRGMREVSENFTREAPLFWETEPQAWQEIVSTNVNGPFFMARAAAPHMVENGWGRIVNISTSRITMVRKGYAPYGPSKAALDAMTRIFAQDLAGTGVTVNALLPGGATDTSFIPGAGPGRTGADGKLLPPDIMNAALLWLVSDAAGDITGARFVGEKWVDGDPQRAREDKGELPLIL